MDSLDRGNFACLDRLVVVVALSVLALGVFVGRSSAQQLNYNVPPDWQISQNPNMTSFQAPGREEGLSIVRLPPSGGSPAMLLHGFLTQFQRQYPQMHVLSEGGGIALIERPGATGLLRERLRISLPQGNEGSSGTHILFWAPAGIFSREEATLSAGSPPVAAAPSAGPGSLALNPASEMLTQAVPSPDQTVKVMLPATWMPAIAFRSRLLAWSPQGEYVSFNSSTVVTPAFANFVKISPMTVPGLEISNPLPPAQILPFKAQTTRWIRNVQVLQPTRVVIRSRDRGRRYGGGCSESALSLRSGPCRDRSKRAIIRASFCPSTAGCADGGRCTHRSIPDEGRAPVKLLDSRGCRARVGFRSAPGSVWKHSRDVEGQGTEGSSTTSRRNERAE